MSTIRLGKRGDVWYACTPCCCWTTASWQRLPFEQNDVTPHPRGRNPKPGRRTRTGWRYYIDRTATGATMATYLRGYVERMPPAAARLASVQLECMPALDVIERYGRAPGVLLYVDPPYLSSTRRSLQYVHELHTEAEHAELAEALVTTPAAVVLSGYRSALYDRLYADWNTVEIAASTQQAGIDGRRTEVLWCNFEPADHLFAEGC